MAIKNVQWSNKTKVTTARLANMVLDEVNSTDNIHPQYGNEGIASVSNIIKGSIGGAGNGIVQNVIHVPFYHDQAFPKYDFSFLFIRSAGTIQVKYSISTIALAQVIVLHDANLSANLYWNYFTTNAAYIDLSAKATGFYLLSTFFSDQTASSEGYGGGTLVKRMDQ